MACDDDDIGEILAFDTSNDLVAISKMITCDGRTATPTGTAVIRRDTADIAYVLAGGAEEEGLLLDNLQFNLLTPTCRVELSKEIYSERETITATVFKLANTSSSQVPILVKAWIVTAGTTPFEVRTLRKNVIWLSSLIIQQ
jgi:hypothetical protein